MERPPDVFRRPFFMERTNGPKKPEISNLQGFSDVHRPPPAADLVKSG
jgi:hypothetical protein